MCRLLNGQNRHLPSKTQSISTYGSSNWEQLCTRNDQPCKWHSFPRIHLIEASPSGMSYAFVCVCVYQDSWLFHRNVWDVFDVNGAMRPYALLMSSLSAQSDSSALVQNRERARSEFTAWLHAPDTKPALCYRRRCHREFKATINY